MIRSIILQQSPLAASAIIFGLACVLTETSAEPFTLDRAEWVAAEDHETFQFETARLKGQFVARERRPEFKGSGHGLRELRFLPTDRDLHPEEGPIASHRRHRGSLNLYRVYSKGESFGALRDSEAAVRRLPDGAELSWEADEKRPVSVKASWRVTGPSQIDLVLEAQPQRDIEAFEIILANYVPIDMVKGLYFSQGESPKAHILRPRTSDESENYDFFPLNAAARENQPNSGRIHSSWKWKTAIPEQNAALPLVYAADERTQIVLMGDPDATSAVCVTPTPVGGPPKDWSGLEKHSAQYLSFFCRDVKQGERLAARARIVFIEAKDDFEAEHHHLYHAFLASVQSGSVSVIAPPKSPLPFPQNRLRDFYAKQARHYLDSDQPLPDVLPQFPGMDGGAYGHWGQNPEADNYDHHLNAIDFGGLLAQVAHHFGEQTPKAVSVSLGNGGDGKERPLSVLFDPMRFTFTDAWRGDLVEWDARRFGINSGVRPTGERFANLSGSGWQMEPEVPTRYLGFYRQGRRVAFSYRIGEASVLDSADNRGGVLTRSLSVEGALPGGATLMLLRASGPMVVEKRDGIQIARMESKAGGPSIIIESSANGLELALDGDRVVLHFPAKPLVEPARILIRDTSSAMPGEGARGLFQADWPDLQSFSRGGPARWADKTVAVKGELGQGSCPYVIDTIPVPYRIANPFGTPMRIGGFDFMPDGRIAVCTLAGDVWLVDGIDEPLGRIQWKRIAAGLNQALGLVVAEGKITVLGRDQITRLHDLNGDDEADYYECLTNEFPTSPGNAYACTLHQDDDGALYWFTRSEGFGYTRMLKGGKPESVATGLRGPNGTGVSPDGRVLLSTTQEGTWTPASAIFEVGGGSYHGFFGPRPEAGEYGYQMPLCFIPRGIDNSSGDIAFIPDDPRWGPLAGKIIGTAYGNCQHYLVLRETIGQSTQGGIVPLPGEFLSGAHRTRFNERDGHFYVAGTDGWETYAKENGSLQRLRYTGGSLRLPVAVETRSNGLIVRFNTPIDPASVQLDEVFCQQWNYLYSKAYGSAEYSVKQPGRKGHDPVQVRSIHLLEDGRSVFVEIPQIHPVMQMHLHMRLRGAEGEPFEPDLYYSIFNMGEPFTEFPGYVSIDKSPAPAFPIADSFPIDSRIAEQDKRGKTTGGVHALTLQAVPGLRFEPTRLQAPPDTLVALNFQNKDVEMPHNVVLTLPGRVDAIGEASMLMAADPQALGKHYVPEIPGVLGLSPILMPGEQYTLYFKSPKTPGSYPFICTFPGHWKIMRGVLHVVAQ